MPADQISLTVKFYPVAIYVYAGCGALALWFRLKYGFDPTGIEKLVKEILLSLHPEALVALLIFVILGSIFSVMITEPETAKQAFTAGATWTVLLSGFVPSPRTGRQRP